MNDTTDHTESTLHLVPFKAEHGLEVVKEMAPNLPHSAGQWEMVCKAIEQSAMACTVIDGSTPIACAAVFISNGAGTLQLLLRSDAPLYPTAETIKTFVAVTFKSHRLKRLQVAVPEDATELQSFYEVLGFVCDRSLPGHGPNAEDYVMMVFAPGGI